MSTFEVWSTAYSAPTDEGDRRSCVSVISADDAEEAAEIYAEERFYDFETPESMELYVKQMPDGERQVFEIHIDYSPNFYAKNCSKGG